MIIFTLLQYRSVLKNKKIQLIHKVTKVLLIRNSSSCFHGLDDVSLFNYFSFTTSEQESIKRGQSGSCTTKRVLYYKMVNSGLQIIFNH